MSSLDTLYTQRDGFEPYALPDDLAWRDDEDEDAFLVRLGYEHTEGLWSVGTSYGYTGKAYELTGDRQDVPRYLVRVGDCSTLQNVFVRDAGSLFALRLQIEPWAQRAENESALGELVTMATKAFRAWHGHDHGAACDRCDPEQMKAIRDMRSKKTARRCGS